MPSDPAFENMMGHAESLSHRRGAFRHWLKPDGEFDLLSDGSTSAIVHLLGAFFDAGRRIGDFAQGHEIATRQLSAKAGSDLGTIPNDTNLVEITNPFAARALDDQVVEQPVDRVGNALALTFAVTAGDGFGHGP